MEKLLYDIFAMLQLGAPMQPPQVLHGGFLHKMYGVHTPKGSFAVKLLNPHIMRREGALANFARAEALEARLEKQGLPIIPALVYGGQKMQQLEGQHFYIYRWYSGRALRGEQITADHCRIMAKVLAGIHGAELRPAEESEPLADIDWTGYAAALAPHDEALSRQLVEHAQMLYAARREGSIALHALPKIHTICHNDMDSKNVLWQGDECRVIDLECLDWGSPDLEAYETALYWAGYDQCRIDEQRLQAFLQAYAEAGGHIAAHGETLYYASCSRLDWLEYNLKRALGTQDDAQAAQLGRTEASATLQKAVYYHKAQQNIIRCLKEFAK